MKSFFKILPKLLLVVALLFGALIWQANAYSKHSICTDPAHTTQEDKELCQ